MGTHSMSHEKKEANKLQRTAEEHGTHNLTTTNFRKLYYHSTLGSVLIQAREHTRMWVQGKKNQPTALGNVLTWSLHLIIISRSRSPASLEIKNQLCGTNKISKGGHKIGRVTKRGKGLEKLKKENGGWLYSKCIVYMVSQFNFINFSQLNFQSEF